MHRRDFYEREREECGSFYGDGFGFEVGCCGGKNCARRVELE